MKRGLVILSGILVLMAVFFLPYVSSLSPGNINSCGTLSLAGTYTLTQDLTTSGTCFTISADNVVLNGNGHKVSGNLDGHGVFANDVNNIEIENMVISDFDFGVDFINVDNSLIEGVNSSSNHWHGIYLYLSSNNRVINSITNSNNNSGIQVYNSTGNKMINNIADSNGWHGIQIYNSTNTEVTGNVLKSNTDNGIYLEESSEDDIINNTAELNHWHGIQIYNSSNNNVVGNLFRNNSNNGIYLQAFSLNNKIINNTAELNHWHGIQFYNSSDGNLVLNNTANSNAGEGIVIQSSSSNSVVNNTFDLNSYGVYLYMNATNNKIKHNVANSNTGYGILIQYASNNIMSNNILKFNKRGISIEFSSSNNEVINNLFDSNNYGVYFYLNSDNNTISGGLINNFTGDAIYLSNDSNGNTLKNVSINNTNSGQDLVFGNSGIDDTELVDMSIGKYDFDNVKHLTIENSNYGLIKFLDSISGEGDNLTGDILFGDDSVEVRSDLHSYLDVPANITLYGIGDRGFNNPTILKDGIICRSKCYNFTSLTSTNVQFNVTGWSNYSIGELDVTPPNIALLSPENKIYNHKNIDLNVSSSSRDISSWWYSLNGGSDNVFTPNTIINAAEGSNNLVVFANDTTGNKVNKSIIFSVDTTLPTITNLLVSIPNDSEYNPRVNYIFKADVSDLNLGSVILQFDGKNYSTSSSGNTYSHNFPTLPAGVFNYTWIALDSVGNLAVKKSSYTVQKNLAQKLNLTIESGENIFYSNLTVPYPQKVNASVKSNESFTLYRNGVNITSENNELEDLPAGFYNFTAIVGGDQNHSASSATLFVNVTKGIPPLVISGVTPIIYGTETDVSGSYCPAQIICILSRENKVYGAGTYTFNYSTQGNENYTSASLVKNITVEKANSSTTLLVNDFPGNITLLYPNQINVSYSTSPLTAKLYRNHFDVTDENNENVTLGVGYYNYTAINEGNENYTGSSVTYFVNVTKAESSTLLTLKLNNQQDNLILQYPQKVNASVETNRPFTLYRNGVNITLENNELEDLPAGFYNFTVMISGNENYTSASITYFANITKAMSSCSISGGNVMYPNNVSVFGSCDNPEANSKLYRGNVDVGNPFNKKLGVGNYSFVINTTETENYTSAENSVDIRVYQNTTWNLSLNIAPSSDVAYGTKTNVTGSGCLSELHCLLSRNGTSVSNPDLQNLSIGTYIYNYSSNGDENYSSKSVVKALNVLDLRKPFVEFVSPTDSGKVERKYIFANATASDEDFKNLTIYLYKGSTLIDSATSENNSLHHKFTGLSNGDYIINATAFDDFGNSNSTTRDVKVSVPDEVNDGGGSINPSSSNVSVFEGNTFVVSPEQFLHGFSADLELGDRFEVQAGSSVVATHYIYVDNYNSSSVYLTVESEPQKFSLGIGNSRKVDVDDDKIYDLILKFNGFVKDKEFVNMEDVNLTIKKIREGISDENVNLSSGSEGNEGNSSVDNVESQGSLGWIIWLIIAIIVIVVIFVVVYSNYDNIREWLGKIRGNNRLRKVKERPNKFKKRLKNSKVKK